MAFAAIGPAIASLGGGSLATGSILLASAAASAGAGLYSAKQSREGGKMQQAELEMEAKSEGDAARQREIERKRTLLRALSTQQAYAGAAGLRSDTGSPRTLADIDIADARSDNEIDNVNTRSRQRALQFRGRNARVAGNAQSAVTLLDTAARTAGAFVR